ncbi:tetratricopeptide repeat protein [Sphingomicrobium nitratireducens]|uniref:tetratricopeptide repeat protein n=1 Tax=Sphingomicrobium nitratireducens TaxID=2964666 RepID=UPI00223FA552|nr:tetratricopeptide repeat protein [Sphingomicrobium nitratireducens]
MALPPQDSASFEREVDENLRRDQLADFGKKYGRWIAIAVVLFLAAAAAIIWYGERRDSKAAEHSEELAKIHTALANGEKDGLADRLVTLADESDGATSAAAMLTEAAIAVEGGDRDRAVELYKTLAADDDLPAPYRDVALLRQTMLDFDRVEPAEVIARLQPLAKPGEPFFGTAGELTAIAMLKLDRKADAGKLFASIAEDETVPATLRSRAVQIAGTLGVDATAALPQSQNQ